MKIPTDLELLNYIYEQYYEKFISYSKEEPNRAAKIYVPIDCKKIAEHFKVDSDIVFGRLYYHLEKVYGYKQNDGVNVHFFALRLGDDPKCINFPLLSSVVAGLRLENRKFWWATGISILALIFSALSLGLTLYKP
jgi:hypothetical protein